MRKKHTNACAQELEKGGFELINYQRSPNEFIVEKALAKTWQ